MSPDLINGLFEFAGSLALCADIRILIRDKQVKGVYWPAKIFFLLWGLWNIYFYGYYDHVWSFWGGLTMTACNATWFILAWLYTTGTSAYSRRFGKLGAGYEDYR